VSAELRVEVRLFARLREQAGTERESLVLPPGTSAGDAYSALRERLPGLPAEPAGLRLAVNREFCAWDRPLADGDELALIPPVSGGAGPGGPLLEVTQLPLDARRLEAAVAQGEAGGICTFTDVVREGADGGRLGAVSPAPLEEEMRRVAEGIAARWPESRVAIARRVGQLDPGEAVLVVSVSSPRRGEAVDACRWGVDRLTEQAR
jgi:MoaE-MoaD fusion protein